MGLPDIAITKWLKRQREEYSFALDELRSLLQKWLSYVAATFPHYTLHTIEHSDALVANASKLLFKPNSRTPVLPISAAEAYVVLAAAYLHDAGMVASDEEKLTILTSPTWKEWVNGPMADRWTAIEAIRQRASGDPAVNAFQADLQTRFLLAEFVRRRHHDRAAQLIKQHGTFFDRFGLDDHRLTKAIAQVCASHGLTQPELRDDERFPELCDLKNEPVNVRWCAYILRLADLLDMRTDRACPLLLNAAAPLPEESTPHWSQYHAIDHFLITPETIEIRASCRDRDEYQLLRDWCEWIAKEAHEATIAMAHSRRHDTWRAPRAETTGDHATIRIRPSNDADFLVDDWKFELDRDQIFQRLTSDLYGDKRAFIRELIQNACDATRVRLYMESVPNGETPPEFPIDFPADVREKYPINISLFTRSVESDSGVAEDRQYFAIEDFGVGMTRDVITKYLLQVGRSYYESDEFRRSFHFTPTSRFGVGFLSVFAVSDDVTVDTMSAIPGTSERPIRLHLQGPRSFVLPQRSDRRNAGTRIEVRLRDGLDRSEILKAIRDWCKRIEFPVNVINDSQTFTITAETADQFTASAVDVDDPKARYAVRAFPFRRDGVIGEIYILAHKKQRTESWTPDRYGYTQQHPTAAMPAVPGLLTCLHGITLSKEDPRGWSARVDLRNSRATTMVRASTTSWRYIRQIREALDHILQNHVGQLPLSEGRKRWQYIQELSWLFSEARIWEDLPATIPIHQDGKIRLISAHDCAAIDRFDMMFHPSWMSVVWLQKYERPELPKTILIQHPAPTLLPEFVESVSPHYANIILRKHHIASCHFSKSRIVVEWKLTKTDRPEIFDDTFVIDFAGVGPVPAVCSVSVGRYRPRLTLVNRQHPIAEWLCSIRQATDADIVRRDLYDRALEHFEGDNLHGLRENLQKWHNPDIPKALRPPKLTLRNGFYW